MIGFLGDLGPELGIITFAVVIGLSIAHVLLVRDRNPETYSANIELAFGLGLLGAVAGMVGGTSRVGAVGDIIPAALGVAGGALAYLFGTKASQSKTALVVTASFAAALSIGYSGGAYLRVKSDAFERSFAFCASAVSDPDLLGSDLALSSFNAYHGQYCALVLGTAFAQTAVDSDDAETRAMVLSRYCQASGDTTGCQPVDH